MFFFLFFFSFFFFTRIICIQSCIYFTECSCALSALCQHDPPGPLPHGLRLQRHLLRGQPLPLAHARRQPLSLSHQRGQPQPQPHDGEPAWPLAHGRLHGRLGQQQRGPSRAQVDRGVLLSEPSLFSAPWPTRGSFGFAAVPLIRHTHTDVERGSKMAYPVIKRSEWTACLVILRDSHMLWFILLPGCVYV